MKVNVNEMTLGGVSIAYLKELNELVKRDASAFMAEQIEFAKSEVKAFVDAADDALANGVEYAPDELRVKELVDILKAIDVVSGVSGIEYDLPYRDQWGYIEGGTLLSGQLDEYFNVYDKSNPIRPLFKQLEGMESDIASNNWVPSN